MRDNTGARLLAYVTGPSTNASSNASTSSQSIESFARTSC
jgi:hypothetical protein